MPSAAPATTGSALVGDCTIGSGWPAPNAGFAAEVVDLVNQHRAGHGLAPLKVSPTLTASARWKASHMARYLYMQHDDPAPPVARTTAQRLAACGYPTNVPWGENIAYGYETPQSVMNGWLGSAGHHANIDGADFRVIGVGAATGSNGYVYWAQNFGAHDDSGASPPPPPPPAPPPPPLPPGPPPTTTPNRAPRIASSSFAVVGEGSTTRVRVRLRVCDDSAGNLVVHVSQRRGRAGRLYARGAFSRTFPGAAGRCRSYRFGWRLGARFVGRGLYAVEIRVRDAGGAWSRRVGSVRIGAR